MKTQMLKTKTALAAIAATLVANGCGNSTSSNAPAALAATETASIANERDDSSSSQTFEIKGTTYKVEEWVRIPELDSGSSKGYGLCVVKTGKGVPMDIVMGGAGGSRQTFLVNAALETSNGEITPVEIFAQGLGDDSIWGARYIFRFCISNGELPLKGRFVDTSKNTREEKELDLSSLKAPVEED